MLKFKKRHSGKQNHIVQRWVTHHRHWRKKGKIYKKKQNILRRRYVMSMYSEKNIKVKFNDSYLLGYKN